MIKGAVIGLGKMGLSHAAIIGAHPDIELAAVCDASSLILNVFNKFSTTTTFNDYEALLNEVDTDFIIVATPTKLHYPIVKSALEKNKHVFCEKPLCLSTTEGRELVSLAENKKVVNQVGFHNHFIGTFRELKRLLEMEVIGDIVHFTGEAYGPVVTKEKGTTWRFKSEEGGGCLNDYASHVINLIQEIISRPRMIKGALKKSIYSKSVEDSVYCLLELESALTGVLMVNWSDETYRKMSTSITVYGKKGKIICDATEIKIYLKEQFSKCKLDQGWTIKYITDLALPVNFHLRGEEYSAQLDYFVDCIASGQVNTINTFEQAMYTDYVIELITRSA